VRLPWGKIKEEAGMELWGMRQEKNHKCQ